MFIGASSWLPRRCALGRKTYEIFAAYLVDAMSIFTVPVVLGGGKKLFADGSAPHSIKLTRSRVSSNGLIIAHYEREGEIKMGDTALGSPANVSLPAGSG